MLLTVNHDVVLGAGRRNRSLAGIAGLLLCLLAFTSLAPAQSSGSSSSTPASSRPTTSSIPTAESSTPPTEAPVAPVSPQDDPTQANPAQTQPQTDQSAGGYVFKKQVEEIVLHAIVVDGQNRLVTGLPRENFQILEDGKPQKVTSFRKERVPIALGILIDNSGSMLPKRMKVNEAALQLVDASQNEDQVFIVNFGDDAFLDQDYTQDVSKLKEALQRVETRGSTALYDAIIAAADHLNDTSPLQKKILLVVTDGRDNASQATLQQVLQKLQAKNGPVLYTIALEQNQSGDYQNRQSLTSLSEQTGGAAFFPTSLDEIQSIATSISQDIRSQYVIGYRSTNSHTPGVYHSIHVDATQGSTQLRVATRTGYTN